MLATVETLVGSQELTRLLGVKRARVYQLSNTPGFPRPVAVLAMGSIWRLADVTAWAEQQGRRLDLSALEPGPVDAEDSDGNDDDATVQREP